MRSPVSKILSFLAVFGLFILVSRLPFFVDLNQLFLDRLQGNLVARPEIVIAAIDDQSLQEVGAWPWDRSIFASLIQQLEQGGARTIGIDVLFLEPREGDVQLQETLNESAVPVVLGSKLIDQQELKSFLAGEKVRTGFTNFPTDSDGKIRRSLIFHTNADKMCSVGFAFSIFNAYLKPKDPVTCSWPFNPILLNINGSVAFHYTDKNFTQYSIKDILNGSVNPSAFKDKIVLIGSTAIDVRNNLNDNFIDIFGMALPGVIIHANVINSLLEENLLMPLPMSLSLLIHLILASVSYLLFRKIKSNVVDLIVLAVEVIVVLIIGLLVFDSGIQWPFVSSLIVLIGTYIFSLAQKFLIANRDRTFIEGAFSQYMNPALVRKLITNPDQLKLGGEKKTMTVMFSDVRGFTTLSEKIAAEELVALLNQYLDSMCEIVLKQQGTIDKFIGDAIMAFWNAPLDDAKHEQHAIETGLWMVKALKEFNTQHQYEPLRIGIGIHTGEMVVGNIGSRQRFDYTVLGDNVNLTSRIEGLTKKYALSLLATAETIKGSKIPDVIFRHVDTVIVKGKSQAVILYQPLESTADNQNLKQKYEEAWDAYAKSDFKAAEKIWKMLSSTDPTSQVMLDRLTEVKKMKSWKGVWEWKEK